MVRNIVAIAMAIGLISAASAQERAFKRCPNGYRFVDGRCHTFGYHDHALQYHQGHFFRHSQPATRMKNTNTGGVDGYPAAKGGGP